MNALMNEHFADVLRFFVSRLNRMWHVVRISMAIHITILTSYVIRAAVLKLQK